MALSERKSETCEYVFKMVFSSTQDIEADPRKNRSEKYSVFGFFSYKMWPNWPRYPKNLDIARFCEGNHGKWRKLSKNQEKWTKKWFLRRVMDVRVRKMNSHDKISHRKWSVWNFFNFLPVLETKISIVPLNFV